MLKAAISSIRDSGNKIFTGFKGEPGEGQKPTPAPVPNSHSTFPRPKKGKSKVEDGEQNELHFSRHLLLGPQGPERHS